MGEGKGIGISRAREQAGLSIEEMSILIGVSERRMLELESDPEKISTRMAGLITNVLGKTIDDIDFTINVESPLCSRCPFGVR